MTTDAIDETLRELTGEFAAQYRLRNEAKEPYSIKIAERKAEDAIAQAKAALNTHYKQLLLKLIGDDEDQNLPVSIDTYTATQRTVGRNQLRTKLREAIEQALPESEPSND